VLTVLANWNPLEGGPPWREEVEAQRSTRAFTMVVSVSSGIYWTASDKTWE
jgi:hypothetical protein